MTLSNAAEIVFLAATVSVQLRFNHDRDGRTATFSIGATFGCVSPKKKLLQIEAIDAIV